MDLFSKLKKMKVMLIDDDEWIRDSMTMFFEGEGCQISAFESAEEGMEALQEHAFDIIIADYRLPGMDGLEFFRHVQKSYPDTVKILITAYGSKELTDEAQGIGIGAFIDKPFTSEVIERSLYKSIEDFGQG